jgi:hypothetical protein
MKIYDTFPILSPQDRLAMAWAVVASDADRLPAVNERVLNRCRKATLRLTAEEALDLLEAVPELIVR